MRRTLIAVTAAALTALAIGCSRPTTACSGPEGSISICVNGKRLVFPEETQPHRHESGSLYAPVHVLAERLGLDVRTYVSADGQSALVSVNKRPFAPAMAHGSRGVHVHDGVVYVPLREFALASGIRLEMDAGVGVAGFAVR